MEIELKLIRQKGRFYFGRDRMVFMDPKTFNAASYISRMDLTRD